MQRQHIAVEVPGSSANLGPGFDALAAALDVVLTVRTIDRGERRVVPVGLGADELPTDDTNLVWRAFAACCERMGVEPPDVSLEVDNAIPLERGMGSSAAAAVAGAAVARALTGAPASDAQVLEIATDLEGHPDNAGAALLGGIVLCADGEVTRFDPAGGLRPVICIPQLRQATSAARGVLPESLPLAAAAANGARVARVLAGLTGHAAWNPAAMHDVLHEPARFGVMTDSGRLVTALRASGIGACLSGAGPSVLAVVPTDDEAASAVIRDSAGPGWDVRGVGWHRRGASKVNLTAATG